MHHGIAYIHSMYIIHTHTHTHTHSLSLAGLSGSVGCLSPCCPPERHLSVSCDVCCQSTPGPRPEPSHTHTTAAGEAG